MLYNYLGLNYKFKNTLGSLANGFVSLLAIVAGSGMVVSVLFNIFSKKSKKTSQPQSEN